MSEKRETLEDADGAVLQGPRDRAKATLPESQSPVVEPSHSSLQRLTGGAVRSGPFDFRGPYPPPGRRWVANRFKGMNGTPTSRSTRSAPNGTRDRLRGASPMVTESP